MYFTLNSSITGLSIKKKKAEDNRSKSVKISRFRLNDEYLTYFAFSKKQKKNTTAYGLDKAFAVLFFNFVLLFITLKVKPNDRQDTPFCPYLRHLLTKLKNEKTHSR